MRALLETLKSVFGVVSQWFERKKTKQARDAEDKIHNYRDHVRDADIKHPDEL